MYLHYNFSRIGSRVYCAMVFFQVDIHIYLNSKTSYSDRWLLRKCRFWGSWHKANCIDYRYVYIIIPQILHHLVLQSFRRSKRMNQFLPFKHFSSIWIAIAMSCVSAEARHQKRNMIADRSRVQKKMVVISLAPWEYTCLLLQKTITLVKQLAIKIAVLRAPRRIFLCKAF